MRRKPSPLLPFTTLSPFLLGVFLILAACAKGGGNSGSGEGGATAASSGKGGETSTSSSMGGSLTVGSGGFGPGGQGGGTGGSSVNVTVASSSSGMNCGPNCNACMCPTADCTMCCAGLGKVDTCTGGKCGCF